MPSDSDLDNSHEYWSQTRHPLVCLVFLTPLLVVYEAGVLWFGDRGPQTLRSGADFWMRDWLQQAGFDQAHLLPMLVVGGLLAWHVVGEYPGQVSTDTLAGMFAESLLFAFVLIVVGQMQDLVFRHWGGATTLSVSAEARIITFIGAGVYEEVMFRLCLLPAAYAVFRLLSLSARGSAILAIVSSSLVFSVAHYVGASADQFTLFSFMFRMLAGLFFAVLFVIRGFGITVGCHAAYDLLVGVLLAARG